MSASIIQHGELDASTSSPTTAVTLTGTVAGNALIAFAYSNFNTVSGISGSLSGAFTQRQAVASAGGNQHLYAYTKDNITGGNEVITATWASAATIRPLCVVEIGSVAGAAYDISSGGDQATPTTTTDAVTTGTATNTKQPALIVGFSTPVANGNRPTAGTGFTGIAITVWTQAYAPQLESKRITTTSAVAATFTATVNNEHFSVQAIFDELLGVHFRKTLSRLGGRVGARQLQA